MEEMDEHQLWLSLTSLKSSSNEHFLSGVEPECQEEKIKLNIFELLPLPAWMTKADETGMNQTILTDFSIDNVNQRIINQLAPEELSLEDVKQLQKLNKDLCAENIKKTLSYMMLEQDYNKLKDEIDVVRKDLGHWQECSGLLKLALSEIYFTRNKFLQDKKLEETTEHNFMDERASASKGEINELRKGIKPRNYSFSKHSALSSEEASPLFKSPTFENINSLKPVDEIISGPPNTFSYYSPSVDLPEDVKQLKISSEFDPFSDTSEMSPRIKFPSSLKKKYVINPEDEFPPRPPKNLSHSATDYHFDSPKYVNQPQGSSESVRVSNEISQRSKFSPAFNRMDAANPPKIYLKDPPNYNYLARRTEFKCHVCDIYLNSESQMYQHFQGKMHKTNYDEYCCLTSSFDD